MGPWWVYRRGYGAVITLPMSEEREEEEREKVGGMKEYKCINSNRVI